MVVYENIDKLLIIYYIDDKNVSINMRLRARAYNINVIISTYFLTTRRRYLLVPISILYRTRRRTTIIILYYTAINRTEIMCAFCNINNVLFTKQANSYREDTL